MREEVLYREGMDHKALEKLERKHRMYSRDVRTMERCIKEWSAKLINIEKQIIKIRRGEP